MEYGPNESVVEGDVAIIKIASGFVKVDAEDLPRVLARGRWFRDGVAGILTSGTSLTGGETTLHRFIMGTEPGVRIHHLNRDKSDNRKANLRVKGGRNQFLVDGLIARIRLMKADDTEAGWAIVDAEDLPRVLSRGRWHESSGGYVICDGFRKEHRVKLHRFLMTPPEDKHVDHVNGDVKDNRKSNLRIATRSENEQNRRGPNKNSTTGVRNVTWHNGANKYMVALTLNGKPRYFGCYGTIEEAAKVAEEKRREFYTHSSENSV